MIVIAASSASPNSSVWQQIEKRLRERHAHVRKVYDTRTQTLRKDMDRLYKEDLEFTKKAIQENLPVEIEVNDKFWDSAPFRVRPKPKASKGFVEPSIIDIDTDELADTLD